MNDDASLLRRFAETRADDAFAELVQRHLNLVYFAALRKTNGHSHNAEEAAQATFTLLAQKAGSLVNHPNLAGWLHTAACNQARELMRAEQRRVQREQTCHAMNELTAAEANDRAWSQIRPVIDDALADLEPDDREAVLLRYFENRPYSEIGDTLRLGENAARMRVTRALEQLETSLARRGVKSTAAALATTLAVPAALAAPAQLGATITSTALASTAVAVTAFSLLKIMSSAKLIATATTIAALIAIGTALYQNQQLHTSRAEAASMRERQVAFQTQLDSLKSQLAAEKKRADEADNDNEKLLSVTSSIIIDKKTAMTSKEIITDESVQARFNNAKQLARAGRYDEALADYLWCFDTGMPQMDKYRGVRSSFLLSSIAELGRNYPPALAALQERRDKAEQRLLANAKDRDALKDFATLNRSLGAQEKTLALFDSLAPDDKRRKTLGYDVKDQLLEAKRYNELVSAYPYESIVRQFNAVSNTDLLGGLPTAEIQRLKQHAARSASKDLEALVGAGDFAHASELLEKIVSVDNSAETRAKIQTHLARAGHPELLKAP
ncbi:MAG: sigma-70 family RNA polymerase sigma factor [Nibricoccus sp.]